jgi:hypothetical protein
VSTTVGTSTTANATAQGQCQLVTLASDGTACVLWCDGTNQKFSYASSPYTSWTTTTLNTGATAWLLSAFLEANGDVQTFSYDGSTSWYKKLTKSGATYSIGSTLSLLADVFTDKGAPAIITKDPTGRYWTIQHAGSASNSDLVYGFESSTPATGWTVGFPGTQTNDDNLPFADLVGNWLLIGGFNGTNDFMTNRADVSAATVDSSSWSAPSHLPTTGLPTASNYFCCRGNGSDMGMVVHDSGAGIYAKQYKSYDDSWGTGVQLSNTIQDRHPTLVKVNQDFYCFWCHYSAANNYSLVYKKWDASTQTWDVSMTTLVASGTNIAFPNATYEDSSTTIAVVYTVGTASPWTVKLETLNITPRKTISASGRFVMAWGIDPPLSLYGLQAAGSVIATAAKMGTAVGGTSATKTTLTGTVQNYGEIWSEGNAAAWQGLASIPAPTGHGFLLDTTILENNTFNAGNWTVAVKLNVNASFTTFTGTLYGRVYKRSSAGVYTQIGSNMSVAANLTTAATVYTLTGTGFPSMKFNVGDRFYIDLWLQKTSTGGATTRTIVLSTSSHATLGIAQQMEITTPGYVVGHTLKASGRFVMSGPAPLVLYGSNVADTTLTTACKMAGATGGTEVGTTTTVSGAGNDAEVRSKGGAGTAVTGIPTTPTGNGWVSSPGAGTFATGNWSASIAMATAVTVNPIVLTLRFFKYSGGSYTSIGTITLSTSTTTTRGVQTFAATSMSTVTFTASDLLYTDLWSNDSFGISGDNPTVYESNSATAGVASDMQITTSTFTPATGGTAHTLDGMGRFKMVAETFKRATGRAAFKVAHTLSSTGRAAFVGTGRRIASGRAAWKVASTRSASGRFKTGIQASYRAAGRLVTRVSHTLSSQGRFRLSAPVEVTRDAAGRFVATVRQVRTATGRLVTRVSRTLSSNGRARFIVLSRKAGMGRVVYTVRHVLSSSGQIRLVARRNLVSMGRVVFLKRHSWQGLGRFVLLAPGSTTRRAIGRFRMVVSHILRSAGRFRLTVSRRLSSSGRAVYVARSTISTQGRATFRVARQRLGQGRAVFIARRTRSGQGYWSLGVKRQLASSGRVQFISRRTRFAVGRFALLVMGQVHRDAQGRFVMRVQPDLMVQAARGTVVVEGAKGQIIVHSPSGTIVLTAER